MTHCIKGWVMFIAIVVKYSLYPANSETPIGWLAIERRKLLRISSWKRLTVEPIWVTENQDVFYWREKQRYAIFKNTSHWMLDFKFVQVALWTWRTARASSVVLKDSNSQYAKMYSWKQKIFDLFEDQISRGTDVPIQHDMALYTCISYWFHLDKVVEKK